MSTSALLQAPCSSVCFHLSLNKWSRSCIQQLCSQCTCKEAIRLHCHLQRTLGKCNLCQRRHMLTFISICIKEGQNGIWWTISNLQYDACSSQPTIYMQISYHKENTLIPFPREIIQILIWLFYPAQSSGSLVEVQDFFQQNNQYVIPCPSPASKQQQSRNIRITVLNRKAWETQWRKWSRGITSIQDSLLISSPMSRLGPWLAFLRKLLLSTDVNVWKLISCLLHHGNS